MYIFSKIGTVLFVGTHAARRLNGALDCMLSYLPRGGSIPTSYIFFFLFSSGVQPCCRNPRFASTNQYVLRTGCAYNYHNEERRN